MPFRDAIVVLGDINVDLLAAAESWPQPGDDCLVPRLEMQLGGVGANCALALSRWGVKPRLVGCIGEDNFGNFLRGRLREHGLDIRWVQTTPAVMTGLLYINVTPDGQRTFFGSRGANMLVCRPPGLKALLRGAKALHLTGYNFLAPKSEGTARLLLKSLHKRKVPISLDVGPAASKLIPQKILKLTREVDLLFANRAESFSLTGQRDPRKALLSLLGSGAKDVVLKLGADGCLILEDGEIREVPPFKIRVVDSTGSGDAFVAAFLLARFRGWTKSEAAIAANAAGAAAARTVGAGENLPDVRDIVRVLRNPLRDRNWDAIRRTALAKTRALKRVESRVRI